MAEGAALLRLPWRVRLRGLYGKSGERPAAQGRSLAPRAIAALRDRGSGARARAVSDQLRKVAYGAPSNCCPAGSQLGSPGKSGERPATQGRPLAPRAIAALTGSRLGSQGKSGATSCARSRMAPRAIAALRERGSGARARAVSDQLRKVAHWRPEQLLPCGNAAREPGQEW
ncbi:hypothetical protein BSK53_12860 [Paenibacillus odorifer]|nr:hypothetical protein BSK53_12860 [Paenibacillus odorifer]